jgi:hypothetical protein
LLHLFSIIQIWCYLICLCVKFSRCGGGGVADAQKGKKRCEGSKSKPESKGERKLTSITSFELPVSGGSASRASILSLLGPKPCGIRQGCLSHILNPLGVHTQKAEIGQKVRRPDCFTDDYLNSPRFCSCGKELMRTD